MRQQRLRRSLEIGAVSDSACSDLLYDLGRSTTGENILTGYQYSEKNFLGTIWAPDITKARSPRDWSKRANPYAIHEDTSFFWHLFHRDMPIFHAVNGGRNGSEWSQNVYWPFHETNLRIRAQTGKLWIVTTDNCHPTSIPCSAPSGVIKPDGNWAVKTPDQGEHMAIFTIELQ